MKKLLVALLAVTVLFVASCSRGENKDAVQNDANGDVAAAENTLAFKKTPDGRYYTVVGIGTYTSEHLVIPSTYNGVMVESVSDGAFSGNVNIKTLTIESGVKKIGASAFSGCSSLTSVRIASTLQKIGSSAFENCSSVKILLFGRGVTDIGKSTFRDCPVERFYYEGTRAELGAVTGLTWCELEYGERYFFSENTPSDSGYFWHFIESGEPSVWVDHVGTEGLKFAISEDGSCYKVTGISDLTKKSVVIPRAHKELPVGEIDAMAFVGSYLREITIPDTVKKISGAAFKSCSYLNAVALPEGVEYIGDDAFSTCAALVSVFLPKSVKTVGRTAFGDSVKIYYASGSEDFKGINVSEADEWLDRVYFYSESEPKNDENGWYRDESGDIAEW